MTNRIVNASAVACLIAASALASAAGAPVPDRLGPMADILNNRVGHWDVDIAFRPAPDAPLARSHATQDNRLEGGWLISEMHGDMGAHPFSGFGINGYDAAHNKYVGVWADSISRALVPVEGTFDAETREFVTMSDQPTAAGVEHVRTVTRVIDKNAEEIALEATLPDGRTFTRMTMHLTRQH